MVYIGKLDGKRKTLLLYKINAPQKAGLCMSVCVCVSV